MLREAPVTTGKSGTRIETKFYYIGDACFLKKHLQIEALEAIILYKEENE